MRAGAVLTFQNLALLNVLASVSYAPGSATLDLRVASVDVQPPGAVLRLVGAEVVLADCGVAEQLYNAVANATAVAPNANYTLVR